MKSKNIYVALNDIAPALIEKAAPPMGAKKRNKKIIYLKRFAALAACLCLIIALSLTWFGNDVVPVSNYPKFFGDESSIGSPYGLSYMPTGISVTAELVEMLTDTYTFYDDWGQQEYGLLKLRTLKLLKGSEMTEEFYYMVPVGYMTDYNVYDKFVITDMAQCGYEYFAMYNKTTGQPERFRGVLFGYGSNSYRFMGERFVAFDENGNFDSRLWLSTDMWRSSTAERTPPATVEGAERLAAVPVYTPASYAHSIKALESGENKDILEDFLSFENGVYVPGFYSNILSTDGKMSFGARRYINGFATNETVSVGKSSYSRSKAQFDENDLAALPDLTSAFYDVKKAFDKGKITPPHIENYENHSLDSYGIFAWYAKTESGVIGIIRVNWEYFYMFDDAYYIIEYGEKKCKPITRDELLERMGEYENSYIYTGKYDYEGKDFLIYGV